MFPANLKNKLQERVLKNEIRTLKTYSKNGIDFFSNDYLGYSKNEILLNEIKQIQLKSSSLGATGSRLISGNSKEIEETENYLANFYNVEAGLLFPSGFIANMALFSCIAQKGDTILYDELIHASIRESVRLSFAKSFSFKHLNYDDLERKIQKAEGEIYIVFEGIYSMDGDLPDVSKLIELKQKYNFHLILDEAHSTGILGENLKGFYEFLPENFCFARIHTFGKAFGFHGAFIAGSFLLKDFLVNFSKPFIYSTGIPLEMALIIQKIHEFHLENGFKMVKKLQENINYYQKIMNSNLNSPIQLLFSNELKQLEEKLLTNNFLIKAIYPPTVPKNTERIRLVLHAFNTKNEIDELKKLTKS